MGTGAPVDYQAEYNRLKAAITLHHSQKALLRQDTLTSETDVAGTPRNQTHARIDR